MTVQIGPNNQIIVTLAPIGPRGRSFVNRGQWVTATVYSFMDFFYDSVTNKLYHTLISHTSSTVEADLASGKIVELLDIAQIEDIRDQVGADKVLAESAAGVATAQAVISANKAIDASSSASAADVSAQASEASKVISSAQAVIATEKAAEVELDRAEVAGNTITVNSQTAIAEAKASEASASAQTAFDKADLASSKATDAANSAIATAADRVQTAADVVTVAADKGTTISAKDTAISAKDTSVEAKNLAVAAKDVAVAIAVDLSGVNAAVSATLTAAQVTGTILDNIGQTAAVDLQLPVAGPGMNFIMMVGAATNFAWRARAAATDKFYLNGVAGADNGYVGISTPTVAAKLAVVSFKTATGIWDWDATVCNGSWVAS